MFHSLADFNFGVFVLLIVARVFISSASSSVPLQLFKEARSWKPMANSNEELKRVCYYAIPRGGGGDGTVKAKLQPEWIDPDLCTHLIVAFARVHNKTIDPQEPNDTQIYRRVVALKEKNPNLKVLLSLGGGGTHAGFPELVRDTEAVAQFCYTAREYLLEYGFDGLDLDWEFPAWPVLQRDPIEKQLFTNFVQQLNNALKLASHPPLLLTIAVAGPKAIIDRSYDVSSLAKYVDWVSIMGYDYHIFWSYLPFTGHNAPLFKRSIEISYFATMNIKWSAEYWLKKGMPKSKLVIGIPIYGRTWKLLSGIWKNVGAPAVGKGILGGDISYPEACKFVQEGGKRYYDNESQVPYAVRDRDWISYEDKQSIRKKVEWIKKSDYAGVMTWNLNCDDITAICGDRNFELHQIIKDIATGTYIS